MNLPPQLDQQRHGSEEHGIPLRVHAQMGKEPSKPILDSRYYLVIDTWSERKAVLDGFSNMIPVSMNIGIAMECF